MSDFESSSSYFGLEDPQWLCMVTLFIASLVTLVLYFVQYFQQRGVGTKQRAAVDNAAKEEAASLLGWALSLKSWKGQWRGAWCRALTDESRKRGVSLMTIEPPVHSMAGQVTPIKVQFVIGGDCSNDLGERKKNHLICAVMQKTQPLQISPHPLTHFLTADTNSITLLCLHHPWSTCVVSPELSS